MADLPCRCLDISFLAKGEEITELKINQLLFCHRNLFMQKWYLDVFGDVDLTWTQVAEARLFDHLTLLVCIGDPQGQAATAGL